MYVHAVYRLGRDLRLGSPEIDSTWPIRRKCSQQEPASSTIYGLGKVIRSRSSEFDPRAGSRNTTRPTTSARRIAAITPTYSESNVRLSAWPKRRRTLLQRQYNTISTPNCIRRRSFGRSLETSVTLSARDLPARNKPLTSRSSNWFVGAANTEVVRFYLICSYLSKRPDFIAPRRKLASTCPPARECAGGREEMITGHCRVVCLGSVFSACKRAFTYRVESAMSVGACVLKDFSDPLCLSHPRISFCERAETFITSK